MGAITSAYDTREAVKEQVQSVGAIDFAYRYEDATDADVLTLPVPDGIESPHV